MKRNAILLTVLLTVASVWAAVDYNINTYAGVHNIGVTGQLQIVGENVTISALEANQLDGQNVLKVITVNRPVLPAGENAVNGSAGFGN